MAKILAYCWKCRNIFPSSISLNGTGTGFIQNSYSRCPNCGSLATIAEGYFDIVDGMIKLMVPLNLSEDRLKTLKNYINEAISIDSDNSLDNTIEALETDIPGIKKLINLSSETRSELYNLLSLLVAILTMLLSQCEGGENKEINTINVINQYNMINVVPNDKPKSIAYPPLDKKIVGPYEPCPCGSGKKFKFCHGQKQK